MKKEEIFVIAKSKLLQNGEVSPAEVNPEFKIKKFKVKVKIMAFYLTTNRYRIVDAETESILDDNEGKGYLTRNKAVKGYSKTL
ncbi:hypothetical protein RyT2_29230 [Pseudolactococcus yaeyamensis]